MNAIILAFLSIGFQDSNEEVDAASRDYAARIEKITQRLDSKKNREFWETKYVRMRGFASETLFLCDGEVIYIGAKSHGFGTYLAKDSKIEMRIGDSASKSTWVLVRWAEKAILLEDNPGEFISFCNQVNSGIDGALSRFYSNIGPLPKGRPDLPVPFKDYIFDKGIEYSIKNVLSEKASEIVPSLSRSVTGTLVRAGYSGDLHPFLGMRIYLGDTNSYRSGYVVAVHANEFDAILEDAKSAPSIVIGKRFSTTLVKSQ